MADNKTEDTKDDNGVGLGVDIVSIERMNKILDETPNFIDYTYNESEIEYCKKSSRWVEHFATHFAAKEAVLKALGNGFLEGTGPKDVEILHNDKGKPYCVLHNRIKEIADEQKIKDIPISLSFTNTDAVAVAIALTEKSAVQNEALNKAVDPVAQLTQKFKEAKKLLEEQDILGHEDDKEKEDQTNNL